MTLTPDADVLADSRGAGDADSDADVCLLIHSALVDADSRALVDADSEADVLADGSHLFDAILMRTCAC